eukprot:scaffold2392_cov228-Prasinococcus_capsulatus_cf.AAC.3
MTSATDGQTIAARKFAARPLEVCVPPTTTPPTTPHHFTHRGGGRALRKLHAEPSCARTSNVHLGHPATVMYSPGRNALHSKPEMRPPSHAPRPTSSLASRGAGRRRALMSPAACRGA